MAGPLGRPEVGAGAAEADGADAGAGALHVFHGEEFLSSPTRSSTLIRGEGAFRKTVAQFTIIITTT